MSVPPSRAQQVIADVLHHVEGEGHNDETAMELAGDVLDALRKAEYTLYRPVDESEDTW